MKFSYSEFIKNDFCRPDRFGALGVVSPCEFSKLQKEHNKNGHGVERALWELRRRTTSDYFRMVYRAQTDALGYSKKVFPTYKFIMPDTLADDWLSTVDWHKKYSTRDHSLHQTLTAYIVAKLLGNGEPRNSLKLSEGSYLLDYCCDKILNGSRMEYFRNYAKSVGADFDTLAPAMQKWWIKDVFYEAAVISALFHDIGYPWQYVNRLAKSIEVAEYGDSLNTICSVIRAKQSIRNRLLIYPFYGYSESNMRHASVQLEKNVTNLIDKGLKESHGLPGALGFMCLNDKIRRYRQIPTFTEATYQLVLDWAAVGIMMHDMAGLYWDDKEKKRPQNPILRLSFDVDPLSSIISMADILEEFYRPSAGFKRVEYNGKQSVDLTYNFPCQETVMYIRERVLYIRYRYETEKDATLNRQRRKDEVKEYFDESKGYIDLTSLGIVRVDCNTEMI